MTGKEIRDAAKLSRSRVRPDFETITQSEAKALGYRAITSSYAIRQFEQCEMLARVMDDFKDADIKLVRNGAGNMVAVWRKTKAH